MYWGKDHLKKMWKQVDLEGVRYGFVKNKTNGFIFAVVDSVLDFDIEEIEIPGVVNDCPVMEIGKFSFSSCHELKKVEFPQCIMVIGTYAFSSCENLSEINVPSMLEKIHYGAFKECRSLNKIDIGPNVKVEEGTFIDCPLDKKYQFQCKYTSSRDMYK
ncbi:MAG: leucine-rich repeat domain-containing protein [Clostridia bacterium]|nr:leucine-rich repeat domain-containing protein [Clostridia bacterium]